MRKLPVGLVELCVFVLLAMIVAAADEPPIAASESQLTAAPNAADSPRRKFADMGVLERSAILTEIRKQDFTSIIKLWLEAGHAERDLMKQGAISTTLAYAMSERTPSLEEFEVMRMFILDSANSNHDRSQLISVLGGSKNKEAVALLLAVATTLTDKELKQSASAAIGRLGSGGGKQEDLSPALERMWGESIDEILLVYVAKALAQVGASSGINLLLDHALAEKDDAQRRAAWGALVSASMLNPNSIPPLAERLSKQPFGSPRNKLLRDTLARLTIPAAAKALLNWLQGADESAAPIVHDYVLAATSPAQIAIWESALNPTVPFRSETNREAIRASLAQFHRDRGY